MPKKHGLLFAVCLSLNSTSWDLFANPTLPEIKKQQEELIKNTQQEQLNENKVERLEVEPSQQTQQIKDDIFFVLRGITITGNNLLTKEDVQDLIQPLLNQSVSSSVLKQLSQQLTQILVAKGYASSRVFVPPQQIKDGKVEFRVEEDKLVNIHVLGKDSFKYEEALFYQYFADLKGKVVHTPTLIERLKYLNFLPASKIKPTLKKVEFGKSALVLVLEPLQDLTTLTVNNNASKFQGDARVTYSTLIANPTGRSDVFNFFAAVNPEYPKYFNSMVASYSVPLGDKGATLSLSHSVLYYQLDPKSIGEGETEGALQYEGDATTSVLRYQKPYLLDWGANSWSVELERRSAAARQITLFSDSLFGGAYGSLYVDQSEILYSLNFSTQHIFGDAWVSKSLPAQNIAKFKVAKVLEGFLDGLTQEDIDLKYLNDGLPVIPAQGPVGNTDDATANFWKVYFNYLRRQVLPWNMNLNFSLNAEYANFDNIPSSYDYGGADSGTSGLDWKLSLVRTFNFDAYVDWLSVEFGFEQQNAYSVFIPNRFNPLDRSVESCGGKVDLIPGEMYRCSLENPYLSLRAKSGDHVLWLNYQTNLKEYSLKEREVTLSYTYVF